VRGDLEHGVGARVDDRLLGREVLDSEPVDDLRARGRLVPEDAGNLRARHERIDDFGRESVGKDGEGAVERTAHHLPVTGRRVLARRALERAAERAGRMRGARHRAHAFDRAEAERCEARHVETSGRFDEVVERVRAGVAERGRVGQRPDPERIEDDAEDALHRELPRDRALDRRADLLFHIVDELRSEVALEQIALAELEAPRTRVEVELVVVLAAVVLGHHHEDDVVGRVELHAKSGHRPQSITGMPPLSTEPGSVG
jgi:hypothetical protein